MARTKPAPPPPPSEDTAAGALMDLLRASGERTERALGTRPAGGLPFQSMATRGLTEAVRVAAPPDPEAVSADRLASNPREAVERRLRRMGYDKNRVKAVAGEKTRSISRVEPLPEAAELPFGLERIIGRNMLMEVSYLEAGQVASRSVGRVIIRDARGRSLGFGTGFLVAPRLLLTNNHVLTSFDVARASQLEFNYQRALDGHVGPTNLFGLDPESFHIASPIKELDFTLVAVKPLSTDGQPLEPFGYLPLTAVADEVLAGECVTIIQHPKGDPKQVALRKNEVITLPNDEDRFLHYQTDTNPGSSGSPVFNDGWEVVALHHSGKPAVDDRGNYLADDGTEWKPEMGLDRVKWLANEGVRVAAIVDFVQKQTRTDAQKALLAPALDPTPRPNKPVASALRADPTPSGDSERRPPEAVPAVLVGPDVLLSHSPAGPSDAPPANAPLMAPGSTSAVSASAVATATMTADGSVVITIPLQITARLAGIPTIARAPAVGAEEAVQIDPNYSDREGYDPKFLGTRDLAVALPKMSKAMIADAAANRLARAGAPSYELPYHHFSVVFHRKRRLAYFTAVNIDGHTPLREKREADKWSFDPRIDQQVQVGDGFYKGTPFDRGHLVRRLDPAWGPSEGVAKAANDDTFHFTNCSPQHKRFNEGKNLWAGVEDYLLDRAGDERRRMTVFTGPVFAKGDQAYRDLLIPKQFWKVAVLPSKSGGLVAAAFVVSQEDLIRPLFAAVPEEATMAQVAQLFQVRVGKVEELTGLDFGKLRDHDPTGGLSTFEAAEGGDRELEDYAQIELG